jgi:hypothetical protein
LPPVRFKHAYTGRKPDIDRAVEGFPRALSPQSQSLPMREFERAIERGEVTTVAAFVLDQLRKIACGTDEQARPRIDDPWLLLFCPLEPLLSKAMFRYAQVRSEVDPGPGTMDRRS